MPTSLVHSQQARLVRHRNKNDRELDRGQRWELQHLAQADGIQQDGGRDGWIIGVVGFETRDDAQVIRVFCPLQPDFHVRGAVRVQEQQADQDHQQKEDQLLD